MDAPERISWSSSPSENNRGFETAIKRIAELAFGKRTFYIACTNTPKKFHACLSVIGNPKEFAKVAADNEIQCLRQMVIDVCQKGLDYPLDGLPLEDIMDYEGNLDECAKTVLMTEGPFSLKYDRLSPSTLNGASLLGGGEVVIKVESGDEKECLFKLFKMLCEDGLQPPTEASR